jgi:hypothetical protein
MMTKKKWLTIFLLGLVIICALYLMNYKVKNPYKTEIYDVEGGFGYKISYNSKLLIKQDHIPAVQYNKVFCSQEDAEKVANFVSEKLYNKKGPKITIENLNSLNINLNCNN